MSQRKNQAGAHSSSAECSTQPEMNIELIRRPGHTGTFVTVSYKISVSGGPSEDALLLIDRTTQQLEQKYGVPSDVERGAQ